MSTLNRLARNIKGLLLNRRPLGLKRLGEGSAVFMPRFIAGRQFVEIGKNSFLMQDARIEALFAHTGRSYTPTVTIGDNVYIGRHLFLTSMVSVHIGDGCVFSDYVYVADGSHGFDPRAGLIMQQHLASKGPVEIGSNCFLGYRVVVTPGVTLGDWCIVGANSVVTRSFPAYSMLAGAPARLIKRYSHELGEWIDA